MKVKKIAAVVLSACLTLLIPNYSRISGIAYENGYVRENSSKTDTLQSFPPKKRRTTPLGVR